MDRRDVLMALPVFSGLSDRDWDKIIDLFSERQYQKDDYIFLEGEAPEALYVVKAGKVKGAPPFDRWKRCGAASRGPWRNAGHCGYV